jgi:ketosteroid isomerase-like protein
MSKENVEIFRATVDAWDRGDWQAALEYAAPDFEVDFSRALGPVHGVFKLDQMVAFLDEVFGQWEEVRFEIDEIIDAGDQVVASFVNTHRGRDGIEVQVRPSGVWTFRDGSIVRACMYQELDEAKEAAGLTE